VGKPGVQGEKLSKIQGTTRVSRQTQTTGDRAGKHLPKNQLGRKVRDEVGHLWY